MTKHEAALMLKRILDDDYASLTYKARVALSMGIDALEASSEDTEAGHSCTDDYCPIEGVSDE